MFLWPSSANCNGIEVDYQKKSITSLSVWSEQSKNPRIKQCSQRMPVQRTGIMYERALECTEQATTHGDRVAFQHSKRPSQAQTIATNGYYTRGGRCTSWLTARTPLDGKHNGNFASLSESSTLALCAYCVLSTVIKWKYTVERICWPISSTCFPPSSALSELLAPMATHWWSCQGPILYHIMYTTDNGRAGTGLSRALPGVVPVPETVSTFQQL